MDERPLYTGLLVLFPVSVLEWVYYTYLVWPFFVSKRASLGRFHFIVCSAYARPLLPRWRLGRSSSPCSRVKVAASH